MSRYVEIVEGKPGRKPRLTPHLANAIALLVAQGAKPRRAAAGMGIHRSTWWEWEQKRDAGVEPYRELMHMIDCVQDAFDATLEVRIARASDWQAAFAILKSRHRTEYGGGEEKRPPSPEDLEKLSDAELEQIVRGGAR